MKKLFALALVVLGLAACQTDHSDLDVQFDGNATITLSIPADAVTRAGGSDSAASGLENTEDEKLRFILAIYDETGTEKIRETQYANENTLTANFPVRLVPGRSYTFVAWADMVDAVENAEEPYDSPYYDVTDLEEIKFKDNMWTVMDEKRDAFTASKTIAYSSTEDLNMQLTRPFAKLRVIATDVEAIKELGLEAKKVTIAFNGKVANSYNAFNQEVASTATRDEFTFDIAEYGDSKDGKLVLYTDYIFANEAQDAVKFSLTTREESDRVIKTVNFNTDIPVKRNMLTTLTGNVMTEGNNVSVEVVPVFPDEGGKHDITAISSYQDLLTAIDEGGEYLVINDIVAGGASSLAATRTSEVATPATGKSTTINLNGFTITVNNPTNEPLISLGNGDTLTFAGEGVIELADESTGSFIDVKEGANVSLEGPAIDNNETNNTDLFVGKTDNVVDHLALLKAAFAGDLELENNTYTLEANVTLSETITLAADKTLVLDLDNFTINGVNNISDKNNDGKITSADNAVLIDVRGALTIKNGTVKFTHKGENFGWNACTENFYVGFNGTLNVKNATIENLGGSDMAYAIDLVNADKNGNGITLNIENSTIKSTYIPVRIFNNGAGMNNVTIKDSTLEGTSRALWVHVYSSKDNGGKGVKDATLNLNIFRNGNTFIASNPNRIIEFGFDDVINFDANGNLLALYPSALEYAFANGLNVTVANDLEVEKLLTLANGKSMTLNLNGKTIKGKSTGNAGNKEMFLVKGNLKVENGTITAEHIGENMGWNAMTTIFDVTAGGVLNLEGVTAKNLGGSDMAFVAHLNNWGEATLNVDNSTLESTYIAVRVFNSGPDMNNVNIQNSTLKGKYCFWVHNYNPAGDNCGNGGGTDATLNIDILNGTNTFEYTGKAPILYGFNNPRYYDAEGNLVIADGLYKKEKTYIVKNANGLVALSGMTINGGENVELGADIDLNGVEFNGLNAFNPENNNTFDGKGHTVSNWTYTGKADDMGFTKNWVGPIKNLTIKNAILRTGGRSAVIAAKPYGNIENCHVVDCNFQANYWACGLIAGMHNSGNMRNCTATNSYVKSTGGTGAITGVLNETSGARTYEGCEVSNCTIYNEGEDPYAGAAIIGLINIDNASIKLVNCTQSNNTYKGTAKDEFIGYNAGDNTTVTIE